MPRNQLSRPTKKSLDLKPKFISKLGLLYQTDCMQLFPKIQDETVDCVFADPPFNLGKNYGSRKVNDNLSQEEYLDWTRRWLTESIRILKPGGSLFVYNVPKWLILIAGYLNTIEDLEFRHWIAVKMKNGFPIKGRLHPAHYGILYYTKSGRKCKFHKVRTPSPTCPHCGELLRSYGGYKKRYKMHQGIPLIQLADFWDDTNPNIHRKSRPRAINELPLTISERVIRISTNKGDVIFDPFVGGGSTLQSAELLNRYWIGCEIGSTNYAVSRLKEEAQSSTRKLFPKKLKQIIDIDQ